MPIDAEHLRQHYASLSDEELVAINRNDLTEVAQKCFDRELERRDLTVEDPEAVEEVKAAIDRWEGDRDEDDEAQDPEDDDEESFVACAFADYGRGESAPDAAEAQAILDAAGIPSRIEVRKVESEPSASHSEFQVVVPSGFSLQATSVLDQQVFNPKMEADWKTHLEALSDEQLRKLNADEICAGLLDRAARLRKAYVEEIRRRKL